MRGTGRAETLKNAKQQIMEAETQEISKIAMGLNTALAVPRATRHPWPHLKNRR